ncbi:UDP-2,3-diacylglucosamine diphosphatase [Maribacter sp. PR1]|uniref:UDP-2,3-diacylglucosamine diphosphatase n=1 Tax=Maribacter cobaltidurans TaxID=1178778 RepID=A0ABU7IS25_9FLAO|nr:MULTISPECIES: UDP-2,3-diacylglucosamine diphosphatase [Maribacter]MDC6388383.1 UDP-2,3-diacylglucosamine diphosphatase [Maribacter sp. PR1]MEE1975772.1 UDP-2,3-diacylglucosamine diphosphatase [Maribacter cobaltidurans]
MKKRKLEIAVISDVHLGTYDSYADELLAYLSSIQPKILILNGDIVDIWQFKKSYFPNSHLNVIKKIVSMASKGTEVHYIMGNHDQAPKTLANISLGNIKFSRKLVLDLNGKKAWFFHGDVFDIPWINCKWMAKFGNLGFSLLINLNKLNNWFLKRLKKEKFSLASKIKENAKKSDKYISSFEETVVDTAIHNRYDYVVCGHIHRPKKENIEKSDAMVTYLNSGDWVENLTALEYSLKRWKLYQYKNDKLSPFYMDEALKEMNINQLIASIAEKNSKKKDIPF